jgi:molybdate transport system substrate-binding protein
MNPRVALRPYRSFFGLFSLLCLLLFPCPSRAEVMAVAAGIAPAVEEALALHVAGGGIPLEMVTGSCGALARQIAAEAPYGMALFSEPRWPRWLEERGLLKESAPFALGKLALWWPQSDRIVDLTVLPWPLALPDPETTAYGFLGKEYLQERGLWKKMEKEERFLIVANAPAAVLAVKSGAAAAAFVPVGTEIKTGGSIAVIAGKTTEMIAGLLPSAGPDSRSFLAYCLSAEAAPVWRRWGFEVTGR